MRACLAHRKFTRKSSNRAHEHTCRYWATTFRNSLKIQGAFHLVKISGIFGSAVNRTRFVSSSHWKVPRKRGKSKKVGPFSQLEFPTGISCSIYSFLVVVVVCTSSRSTARKSVGHHNVPGFTTKWNNFLPIGNSTFAPTEISGFFSQMESAP